MARSVGLRGALSDIARMDSLTWMRFGLCRGLGTDLFFTADLGGDREAKAICAECPAQAACLDYAIENNIPYGVWGGQSEAERRRARIRGRTEREVQR